MKAGLSLTQLAQEIERQAQNKHDYVAPVSKLVMYVPEGAKRARVNLVGSTSQALAVTDHAHGQIAEYTGIPTAYYRKMAAEQPELLARNVNTWVETKGAEKRMVRTLDGSLRALLSDRYRPLDNFDLMEAVLPTLLETPSIRIESSQVTETRLYIKAVFPKVEGEIRKGDVVQAGIVISNSEVGSGALQISPLVYRLVCLNGLIAPDYGSRRNHTGKRLTAENDETFKLLSDRTRALDDAAFFSKVRDIVRGTLTADVFQRIVNSMKLATEQPLEVANLNEIVEVTGDRFGYSQKTKAGVLTHLIQGGDMTRYGLMNAITRQAQDEDSYDFSTQMETDGHRIIELPQGQWKEILKQAA